ncbi:MAG: hypothetical protein AAGI68_07565 [Planctomycetota bacterium]
MTPAPANPIPVASGLPVSGESAGKRLTRLLAQLRRRQLDHALRGRVVDSARYADRAQRVMQVPCRDGG